MAGLKNIELKMFVTGAETGGFHTKGYIFREEEIYRIIIGSSNMTLSAITKNKEWNTKIVSTEQGELTQAVLQEFDELWQDEHSLDFEDFIDSYRQEYLNEKMIRKQKQQAVSEQVIELENYRLKPNKMQNYRLKPNKMQIAFVKNVMEMRAQHIDRALLLSSTGTGKSLASAFMLREMGTRRALFIVHREQIAKQTLKSYKRVFGSSRTYGLLSGNSRELGAEFLFATMQMMSKEEIRSHYSPEDFDVIILDECHHVGAESYQKIMQYFKPKFWLGMTASPDTDYSGSPAHPGRSSAQPDRASAHLIRSAVQLMPVEARKMARKINVKLIMELRDAGLSRSTIASTRHISRHSVSDVFNIADEKGIRYSDIRNLEEQEVYRLFYPEKFANETMYGDPDYEHVHQELKKMGVTLKLLHEEYVERCERNGEIPMGKTKFNEGYAEFTIANRLTNHLEHKPGERAEVDWSGPTMRYVDISTGELITVYLFVGTLPYSQYSYVEPCLNMKMDTFIRCHIHMYEYFGGVPMRTVCDNLKTGVVSHPKEGEIVLTDDYAALGSHYMTAIIPAGVRKPKQKPSVEGTVGKIATAIIARCRNETYYSFVELKKGVADKLYTFNHEAFRAKAAAMKYCRKSGIISGLFRTSLMRSPSGSMAGLSTSTSMSYTRKTGIPAHISTQRRRLISRSLTDSWRSITKASV